MAPHSARARDRPRIVFVNRLFHPDHSATSQLLSDLAFSLCDRFDVVVVASRQRYDDPAATLPARETVRGVTVHRVASTRFRRGGLAGRLVDLASFHGAVWLALARLAGRGDLVVVKTDPPLLSIGAAWAARLKGARVINWLQDVYPEIATALGVRGLDGFLGRRLRALRDRSLVEARDNVVIGERMAAYLRARGAPAGRIRVIPNWIDEETVTPVDHGANPLRRAWDLEGKFVVAYSGNLGRVHEYETMLGAARALRDDPSIVFLMIGGGHATSGLRDAVRAEALANVVFRPYQPGNSLGRSLSVADLHWVSLRPALEDFVLPSKVYGVLAAGRPIIAITAPDGEVARLVAHHGCGVQVDPGDQTGCTRVIRGLACDPDRTARLGAAARAAAAGPFSRRRALARWRETLSAAAE
jgi:glycosyltransferase involved in cell wall biosynthesis